MIDLKDLRRAIENAADGRRGAIVSRRWLEQVERELLTGNAALAELAALRANREVSA